MSNLLTGTMLALTLRMTDPNGGIELGEIRQFDDWVSGCDNAMSCEAIALSSGGKIASSGENIPGTASLLLARERATGAGADGAPLTIRLEGLPGNADRYRVMIDGKLVDTGGIDTDSGEITVQSLDAVRLADAIARGRQMQVIDGKNAHIASFSLKGSAASLRHIDVKLGLNGTQQAIVAHGKRKIRQPDNELPVVIARRVSAGGQVPEAGDIIDFADRSDCSRYRIGVTEDRTYSLGQKDGSDYALVLLSCGTGAHNNANAAFVAISTGSDQWTFTPARFDLPPRGDRAPENLPLLFNAEWNSENQRLSSTAMNRRLGDCGDTASYVWDGARFRLAQARSMPACRGTLNWITVWRARIVFHG